MVSPFFQIGHQIGQNLGKYQERAKDENAIEQILSQAMSANDPAVLQHSIGRILSQVSPERQGAAVQYLQSAYNSVQKRQEQARLEQQEREAATASGYTPFAPPAVQAQQVKDKNKADRLAPYGLAGGTQQPNQSQNINSQLPEENVSPAPESPKPASVFENMTDHQLEIATGSPDREVSEPAKAVLNRRMAAKELEEKNKIATRKERIEFHKESQKYDEELTNKTKIAKTQAETFKNIEQAINSGNVKPFSMANILKSMGPIGELMGNAILNKDQTTLLASIPALLEGWKDVFGVRLTDADLRILQDKLPSIGKTPEANKAIINVMKKYSDLTLLRQRIAADIKKNNEGLRPLGYADMIESRYDEMTQPVKIINPNTGRAIEIPAYKVSEAIASGAKLAPQQGAE